MVGSTARSVHSVGGCSIAFSQNSTAVRRPSPKIHFIAIAVVNLLGRQKHSP